MKRALAESPLVSDVYVYGVKAASGAPGEKDVVAAVVPANPGEICAQALFRHCREKLEASSVPSYFQMVGEIPKTASEKPIERFLLEAFNQGSEKIFTEEGTRLRCADQPNNQ